MLGTRLCDPCWEQKRHGFDYGAPFTESESVADDVVGLVAGVIEHRRCHQDAYGALNMTADQRDELARAVAANLIAVYRMEKLT